MFRKVLRFEDVPFFPKGRTREERLEEAARLFALLTKNEKEMQWWLIKTAPLRWLMRLAYWAKGLAYRWKLWRVYGKLADVINWLSWRRVPSITLK